MIARHNAALLTVLEQVQDLGCAVVYKTQLVRWYGQERLTKSIWRDIETKWREELEEKAPLLAGVNEETVVLVYGDKGWLQSVGGLSA